MHRAKRPIINLLFLPQRLDLSVGGEESKYNYDAADLEAAGRLQKMDALLQVLVCLPRLKELQMCPVGDHEPLSLQPDTMQLLLNLASRGRISVKVMKSIDLYLLGVRSLSDAILNDASAVDRLWE